MLTLAKIRSQVHSKTCLIAELITGRKMIIISPPEFIPFRFVLSQVHSLGGNGWNLNNIGIYIVGGKAIEC